MNLILDGLYSFFVGLFGRFLSDTMLRFVAYKALLFTFLTVTFPVVVKNLVTWLYDTMVSVASSSMTNTDITSVVIQFTEMGGYLASHLLLPDCIAIILTAVAIRLALNFIPFVG